MTKSTKEILLGYIEFIAAGALRAACSGYPAQELPELIWNLTRLEDYAEQQDILGKGGIDAYYMERLPRSDALGLPFGVQDLEILTAATGLARDVCSAIGLERYAGDETRERLARELFRMVLRAMESDWHRGHFNAQEAEIMDEWASVTSMLIVAHFGEDVADRENAAVAAEAYPPCDDSVLLDCITYRGSRAAWLLSALLNDPHTT